MTPSELKTLIDSDPTAKALFAAGNDSACAVRCGEIAPVALVAFVRRIVSPVRSEFSAGDSMPSKPKPPPWEPPYVYRAEIVGVHDGDTVTARVDVGFSVSTYTDLRLLGINAPELKSGKPGKDADYGDALNVAINAVIDLDGIALEICGAWIWVSGNTYPHKAAFKTAGFMWASKKRQWYFRPPEWQSSNRYGEWDMDSIREKFGSETIDPCRGSGKGQAKQIQ